MELRRFLVISLGCDMHYADYLSPGHMQEVCYLLPGDLHRAHSGDCSPSNVDDVGRIIESVLSICYQV